MLTSHLKPETIELLTKIKEAIQKHPGHFSMNEWLRADSCGTTACIAGWALCLGQNNLTVPDDEKQAVNLIESADAAIWSGFECSRAIRLLQISDEQAYRLFYWGSWPQSFRTEFCDLLDQNMDQTRQLADVACRRIDHFILTDE